MKPVRVEWGPSRAGLGGEACIGCKTRPWLPGSRIGQVGPRGAGLGRGQAGRAECGVGHALTPRLGPGCKESGAAWGRFGPSGAE